MAGARPAPEVPTLRGRQDELAMLDGLLDEARAGRSGVLVVLGEAGIGKTALLEHAVESAPDFALLRAGGVESEMELAFAALHQLCAPVDDFVDRLPAPQRAALEITFGVSAGAAPDRFLVSLATLSLFSRTPRRNARCSVSSTTRSGWTAPPPRRWASSGGGCWRSRSSSCSPRAR
jgi:hypothetical protein